MSSPTIRWLYSASVPGAGWQRRLILTDQQRYPTPYEPEALTQWRHDEFAAERGLHETGALREHMLGLLVEQLAVKRLVPSAGAVPGHRPPASDSFAVPA